MTHREEKLLELLHGEPKPLVYCYRNEDDDIVYIGSTINLKQRLYHRIYCCDILFDRVYRKNPDKYTLYIIKVCETEEECRTLEKHLIWKYMPEFNIQHNEKP